MNTSTDLERFHAQFHCVTSWIDHHLLRVPQRNPNLGLPPAFLILSSLSPPKSELTTRSLLISSFLSRRSTMLFSRRPRSEMTLPARLGSSTVLWLRILRFIERLKQRPNRMTYSVLESVLAFSSRTSWRYLA